MIELLTAMAGAYEAERYNAGRDPNVVSYENIAKRAMAAALRQGADVMKHSGNEHQIMAAITIESLVDLADEAK